MAEIQENQWGSRYIFLMALLAQIIGNDIFLTTSNSAVNIGAVGHIMVTVAGYIVLGIPLLYMELAVSQFTARDCLDIWKARAFLSHLGYVQIVCQLILVFNNHIITSFIIYYLLITFENPIPYYNCGEWATADCNMIELNYTVNHECLLRGGPRYCNNLYKTFPEYQFWKYFLLGYQLDHKHVAWRVLLASGVSCGFMFLCCFRAKQSVRWFIKFTTIFPILGYFIFLTVSMLQKGVITYYEIAFDTSFEMFSSKFSVPKILTEVIITLNIGTGVSFNMSAGNSFRSPCYSNVIIMMAICSCLVLLVVCTTVTMSCPYFHDRGFDPVVLFEYPISLLFEKVPMFLKFYSNNRLWLVLMFSSNAFHGLNSNVIPIINFQDIIMRRFEKTVNYPGFITLAVVSVMFLLTIPGLGHSGLQFAMGLRRFVALTSMLLVIIEVAVFILWYGLDRFSEDIHFMQGFQSKNLIKVSYFLSCAITICLLCSEIFFDIINPNLPTIRLIALYMFILCVAGSVLIILVRLSVAAFKKRFREQVQLDITWGPRSDVLLRSRAMFTARAMTKEYLYRQYHIQAGILARQRRANVRDQGIQEM